jgi:hypothetical protein
LPKTLAEKDSATRLIVVLEGASLETVKVGLRPPPHLTTQRVQFPFRGPIGFNYSGARSWTVNFGRRLTACLRHHNTSDKI